MEFRIFLLVITRFSYQTLAGIVRKMGFQTLVNYALEIDDVGSYESFKSQVKF